MASPLTPGVYVREEPGGPRSIEAAPTSIAIFVGETERGPLEPTLVTSPTGFERHFGGYFRHRVANPGAANNNASDFSKLLSRYSVQGFFDNGGPSCYVLRTLDGANPATAGRTWTVAGVDGSIQASSPGVWGNFVAAAVSDPLNGLGLATRFRVRVYYQTPAASPNLLAPPVQADRRVQLVEDFDGLSIDPTDENYVVNVLARSRYIRWAEGAALGVVRPPNDGAPDPTAANFFQTLGLANAPDGSAGTGGDGTLATANYDTEMNNRLEGVRDAALLINASDQLLPGGLADANYMTMTNEFITYVDNGRPRRDLFFVGDYPRFATATPVQDVAAAANNGNPTPSDHSGMYWPHIRVGDPVGEGRNPSIVLPPAGHIAGLYGRTDSRRGVWKAPAGFNLQIGGAIELDFDVLDTHQSFLNPLGVNALRRIPRAGLVIWGARTRRPSTEWRYIPVRRTAMFLRASIYNAIHWAVFEGNNQNLWSALRAQIGAFMEAQFRNGAFAGEVSSEGYFVKVDEDTTTPADQAAGVVNILVGFAPLHPAEFVIVRLSQITRSAA